MSRRDKYKGMGYNVNKSDTQIKMNFDLQILNLMCCFVLSENRSIKRSHLVSLKNLIHSLDLELYVNDIEKLKRIKFIKKGISAKLDGGLKDPYMIIKEINGGIMDNDIIDPEETNTILSNEQIHWINKKVSSALKYSFIYNNGDRLIDMYTKIQSDDTVMNKEELVAEFEMLIDEFKNDFRRSKVLEQHDMILSLHGEDFDHNVRDIHAELTNPSSRMLCGMQGLNEMSGGGFENGRCYTFFGMSGSFKSGTLLSLAYQLKKYNKNYETKDPSKRPAIVILTMENTIKETLERLFNMSSAADDIRNFSADEVIRLLKTQGELYLNDESPIDIIIKYKPNGSVDTSYLYTLVEELEDEGIETICLIQDYIRRIRTANTTARSDVRLELGEVVNEFKVFAGLKDIPLITAAQLNRDAAKSVETAKLSNKSDLIRTLGRSNVGESMLMIDNLDWACIIHIEYDGMGNKYLGFNNIKARYCQIPRTIFYYPFMHDNEMRLTEDFYSAVPILKESLRDSSDMLNDGKPQAGASAYGVQRRSIDDILADRNRTIEDENVFNSSSSYSSNTIINTIDPSIIPIERFCPVNLH